MNSTVNLCITITLLLFSAFSSLVWGANECRIQYGWNTGNSFQGTFKNHSKKRYLNKGQTRTINKNRMNFVKNLKTRQVKFYLSGSGASNVTLNKNQRNPVVGTYAGTPKLVKVKCLNTSTSSSSSPAPASPAALIQTLKNQNVPIKQIAQQLKSSFNKTYGQIVQLLKSAGFNKTQIAGALDSAFNLNPSQILSALKAGYSNLSLNSAANILQGLGSSGLKIVGALKTVLNGSIDNVAKAMKQAGYSTPAKMSQMAGWLTTKFNATPELVVRALYRAGYKLKTIVRYMINTLKLKLKKAVKILKQLAVPGTDVAIAVADAGIGATALTVAAAFRAAGWTATSVMKSIKLAFKIPPTVAAAAFKAANYSADITTKTLKFVFKISRASAKKALEYAKFQASQIQQALNRYYGQARQAAERNAKNVQQRLNTARQGIGLAAPAVAAAAIELQGWFVKAEINKRKCTVNAITATGGPGVLTSNYRWKRLVKTALKNAGLSDSVAAKWDSAFKQSFMNWGQNVTIPGLPWYPAFAAYPAAGNGRLKPVISRGSMTPPLPNVPTPLLSLTSRSTPGMTPPVLKTTIVSALGRAATSQTKDAVSAFATQIGGRFSKFLANAQVMRVFGSGRVQLAPGGSVGPVVGGSCWGKSVLAAGAGTF